jgi:hypothetical protein
MARKPKNVKLSQWEQIDRALTDFLNARKQECITEEKPEPKLRLVSSQSAAGATPRAKHRLPVASVIPV